MLNGGFSGLAKLLGVGNSYGSQAGMYAPTEKTFTPGLYNETARQFFNNKDNAGLAYTVWRQNQRKKSPWLANALNSPQRQADVWAQYNAANVNNTAPGSTVGATNFTDWLDNNFDAGRYVHSLGQQDQGLRPSAFMRGFRQVGA